MGQRTCEIDGCERKHCARGLCKYHYNKGYKEKCGEPKRGTTKVQCGTCSTDFDARNDELKRGRGKYCSSACYLAAPRHFVCHRCGTQFSRHGLGLGLSAGTGRVYCTDVCRDDAELHKATKARARAVRRMRERAATAETFAPHEIFERDGWRCGICRRKVNAKLTYPNPKSASLDHIVPLVDGGEHARTNVQCSHLECNKGKHHTGPGQLLLIG